MNVDLLLKVDNRAMEQDEIISLSLTQITGRNVQGVFVINVLIIDSDGKCKLVCFLDLYIYFYILVFILLHIILSFNS